MEGITQTQCEKNKDKCFETNIKPLMEKLDKVEEKVNKIALDLAGLPERLIEKLDIRYADKKTETKLDKMIMVVITAVILGVIALIFKK